MTDLLAYWNLRERPFEATWDTRFYFQSRDHDEALNRLAYLVAERTMNIGMLTGEVGCGKTLTRAVFMARLDAKQFAVIVQDTSAFPFKDLLGSVLQTLDPSGVGTTKFSRCDRLCKAAKRLSEEGRHLVLIFDEAQEMTPATMNDLKMLTNLNGGGQNYLTIVLLGQPELRSKVVKLPAIDQRISLRFHLSPLNLTEAGAYLVHRLKAAGHPSGEVFAPEGVAQLFSACHGVPRELNRLAKLALEVAWLRQMPQVSVEAVDMVIRDLSRHQNLCAA
ncbi:MAG: ral secretion pathway protein GspA [Verrucomicrobiales bacterium]|nr:ral secretion pathway protein GspA [Verrucomicrobiales bacterium]